MKYLPREENKLVQAIRRKDWPAVRNILENEPHLIETSDEDGYTPLMRAVINNAPDDVLENMIKTATVENLEHQTLLGDSILHFLVRYARVSTLRRVLQRTNTKINTQDKYFGQTPLHDCLYDWRLTTRSYEYHKEAAIVLITYGASASIKNKNGKTPLDFYEKNRCRGYEETTRNEKKRELKELLEKLSTPSEILARGPDAVKAFKDALKNGEITVVNSRLMFLGQEGSGKTSCVKAMLGKEFNKDEPSTDGIVRTIVFQTVGEDYSKWEEQKDIDECEQTKQILEHSIAVDVAKKMKQPKTEQNKYKNSSDQQNKYLYKNLSSPGSVVSTSAAEDEQPESEISKGKPVAQDTTEVSTNQLILRKKVFETMVNKSSGPMDLTCIWDYAGQLDYYITHRFFLTDRTSYAVVFSLLDALDKLAKSRDPKKGFLEMTNLQSILFWIRSIFEHAVLLHGSQSKNVINEKIASPPISLVGTHADLLTGTDAEKRKKVDDIFDSIFKAIEGEPYECHIDRERYAVDNTTALDEGIQRLKKNVGGYLKTMARTVPIKWVEFQIMVQEAGKTTLRMSLEKIIKLAVECGINDENVIHVLNYFNDLGIILYSPTNEKLKNTVITNIHMLIGIFMKIITVVKPGDKVPVMIKHWHKLDNEGILAEPLARYLWRNELKSTASEDGDDVIFEDFIELMKKFGLLLVLEKNASDDGTRLFVVPSRMKKKTDNRLDIKKDDEQTVSIYVTPKDFLPDAVYNILVVRFVNLSQNKGCRANPKLFQNQSTIRFGNKHYLKLGRISIDSKPSLKVLNVLKQNLDEVYRCKQDVGYLLKILCPCSLEHFQELDNCLDNEYIDCDKTGAYKAIPTANVQKLFLAEYAHKTLSDEEFGMLKVVVSNWYDRYESLPMLKVLFRDHVEHGVLSTVTKTMDLLSILFRLDHLHSQKLGLLFDTINITKHFGLLSKIKEKLPSFPDEKDGSNFTKFTPHRQTLMRIGMVLTSANVMQIDGLYNTPCKKYAGAWKMITDLEDRMKIIEGNMKEFIDILEKLELRRALSIINIK